MNFIEAFRLMMNNKKMTCGNIDDRFFYIIDEEIRCSYKCSYPSYVKMSSHIILVWSVFILGCSPIFFIVLST